MTPRSRPVGEAFPTRRAIPCDCGSKEHQQDRGAWRCRLCKRLLPRSRQRDLRLATHRYLCAYCGDPLEGRRRRYCSGACAAEVEIRAGVVESVRHHLRERDREVCARCGLDCAALRQARAALGRSSPLPWSAAEETWRRVADIVRPLVDLRFRAGAGASAWHGYEKTILRRVDIYLERRGFDLHRSLWTADHALPVVEGGGGCGLDGYRTLCRPCDKIVTAALAARLAAVRRMAAGGGEQLPLFEASPCS